MIDFKKQILILSIVPLSFGNLTTQSIGVLSNPSEDNSLLTQQEMSLDNRYEDKFVNDVFKNNILLNLAYLRGSITSAKDIKWEEVAKPFSYQFILNPDKTFAYHEDVDNSYQGKVEKTTNSHFNAAEGFKTDGYLYGDGVCHLASLLFLAAKQAGLEAEAPTNHDFANIPDIPKEYGVSIYSTPGAKNSNTKQNLYITNNKNKPIAFKFEYQNNRIKVAIVELN